MMTSEEYKAMYEEMVYDHFLFSLTYVNGGGCLQRSIWCMTDFVNPGFKREFYIGTYDETLSEEIFEAVCSECLNKRKKEISNTNELPELLLNEKTRLEKVRDLATIENDILLQGTARSVRDILRRPGFLIQSISERLKTFDASKIESDLRTFKNVDLSKNLDFLEGIYGQGFKEQLQKFTETYTTTVEQLDSEVQSEIKKLLTPIELLVNKKPICAEEFIKGDFYNSVISGGKAYIDIVGDEDCTDTGELLAKYPLVDRFLADLESAKYVNDTKPRGAAVACIYGLTQRKLISFERVSK